MRICTRKREGGAEREERGEKEDKNKEKIGKKKSDRGQKRKGEMGEEGAGAGVAWACADDPFDNEGRSRLG